MIERYLNSSNHEYWKGIFRSHPFNWTLMEYEQTYLHIGILDRCLFWKVDRKYFYYTSKNLHLVKCGWNWSCIALCVIMPKSVGTRSYTHRVSHSKSYPLLILFFSRLHSGWYDVICKIDSNMYGIYR